MYALYEIRQRRGQLTVKPDRVLYDTNLVMGSLPIEVRYLEPYTKVRGLTPYPLPYDDILLVKQGYRIREVSVARLLYTELVAQRHAELVSPRAQAAAILDNLRVYHGNHQLREYPQLLAGEHAPL